MISNTANQLLKFISSLTEIEQVFSFFSCYNQFDECFLQEYFSQNYNIILSENIFTLIEKLKIFLGIDVMNVSNRIHDIETSKKKFVYVYSPIYDCLRCNIGVKVYGSIQNANLYSVESIAKP